MSESNRQQDRQEDDIRVLDRKPVRPLTPEQRRLLSSPHLINLSRTDEDERRRAEVIRKASALDRSKRPSRLQQILDEKIHLHDLSVRSLSVRQRGWKDFPPNTSRTLVHAIVMTVGRFFREHPLADLTVFSLIHITAAVIWKTIGRPIDISIAALWGKNEHPTASIIAAPSLLTFAAIPEPIPVKMTTVYIPPAGWKRGLIGFAATALLFILPLGAYGTIDSLNESKTLVLDRSMQGMALLKSASDAAKQQNFEVASSAFTEAARNFSGAKEELGSLGNLITYGAALVPGDSPLSAAQPILTAGREVSIGGAMLARAFAGLDEDADPIVRLRTLRDNLSASLPHLNLAAAAIGKITPEALPEEYRATFTEAKRELPRLASTISEAVEVAGLLQLILGADGKKRYLLVFQNNAEIRPTGGFIGSFALLDVEQGEITNLEVPGGGSYDLQGSLRAHIIAPQPLHLINPHWQFQDANWSPDFPTSAQRLTWFYEKSGGPTTDGVIAMNMSLMTRILSVVGAVDMPDYDLTIDADNFYLETQREVELDYDKEMNKPKQFIADLAPKVLERLSGAEKETLLGIIDLMDDALVRKDLQLWMRDEDIQSEIREFGWTGEMQQTDGDYLQIVHTNIAGQKTDLAMRDKVTHDTKILADGTGIVTLTIERTHTGTKDDLFSGVRNVDYMRVYAPASSVLVEAEGFDIPDPKLFKVPDGSYVVDPEIDAYESAIRTHKDSGTRIWDEEDKTVFGNWVQTDPGATSVVTLVYRLAPGVVKVFEPNDSRIAELYRDLVDAGGRTLSYSLLIQKQSGLHPVEFTSYVNPPRGYYMEWQSPQRIRDDRGRYGVDMTLEHDQLLTTVVQTR